MVMGHAEVAELWEEACHYVRDFVQGVFQRGQAFTLHIHRGLLSVDFKGTAQPKSSPNQKKVFLWFMVLFRPHYGCRNCPCVKQAVMSRLVHP